MKTLNTLIRLHKRNLDELRRSMFALERQKDHLIQTIEASQRELEREVDLAKNTPEMSSFFGEFAKRIKNRQEKIHKEIQAIDKKITELNNKMAQEFTELKKFEIALENAKNRIKTEEIRKETLMLDEIAAQQFHNKNSV